jgi:hypothetical protein
LSSGSSPARTSVIPACAASRAAARWLSPVSSTGPCPVIAVIAAVAQRTSGSDPILTAGF